MIKILKTYGIPPQVMGGISKLYENTRENVVTTETETDHFVIKEGVL